MATVRTADTEDVPTDRMRLFTLSAAAVYVAGTFPMIRAGIAPYANPTSVLQIAATTARPRTDPVNSSPFVYPGAMIRQPTSSVVFGPLRAESFPPMGTPSSDHPAPCTDLS
ncbi:hypothetical protein L618_000500001180 [Rhodococcus rhodochrous J45]|uniref:Uncharacterized protein n=1 Tax=Rhodococcus rhodochrous J45 TaxID=935266 RepID=A0A562DJE9_RHORH|nr:hypothetical protein L618_000500001180 [Rhodococcus rhodochrous J45]